MPQSSRYFASCKILILEDDYLIARDIGHELQTAGASIVGPFAKLDQALSILTSQQVDGAVLDVKLADDLCFVLAERLLERDVPFMFITGLTDDSFPDHLRDLPRIAKPFSTYQILDWLRSALSVQPGMPIARDEPLSNILINNFSAVDTTRLRPHMLRVRLKRRTVLQPRNRVIERVYFPETCIGSMLVGSGDKFAQVGMIGREGAIGLSVFDKTLISPADFIVQAEGDAIAISAVELNTAINGSLPLASLFFRFQYLLSYQIAHTALAHAAYSVEQHLARWLLMYEDRIGKRVSIVHEYLSLMLHVRRASVTLALQSFESLGAISTERGQIVIRNRQKLLTLAGSSYGEPEREQARLFPKKNQLHR